MSDIRYNDDDDDDERRYAISEFFQSPSSEKDWERFRNQFWSSQASQDSQMAANSALEALAEYGSDDEELVYHPSSPQESTLTRIAAFHDDHDVPTTSDPNLLAENTSKNDGEPMSQPITVPTLTSPLISDRDCLTRGGSPLMFSSQPVHKLSRIKQEYARRFLDIEAIDDEEEEMARDSDISEDDFIEYSMPGDASISQSSTSTFVLPRTETATTRFIDHLEETYVHGSQTLIEESESQTIEEITRTNHQDRDWVETVLLEATHLPDDWVLFRADCKSGSEYNILFDVMDSPILQREVRSAFYNPSLGSHIYFEASIPHDRPSVLMNFLTVHSDIYVSSLFCVQPIDHKACLRILPHNDRIFSPGTWVKIQSPGRLNIAVALVPRIVREWDEPDPPRPKLDILTEDHLDENDIERRTANGISYFKSYDRIFLTGYVVCGARHILDNRRLFIESKHPFVLQRLSSMPTPELWHFEEGESVSIVGEELDLHGEIARGIIIEVFIGECEVETNVGETVVVHMDHLVKRFVPGDYVKVMKGTHTDTKGLVGERDGRVLGLIPDSSHSVSIWVDVNSVTAAVSDSSLPMPTNNFPWKDLKVRRIDHDFYAQIEGVIKRAWPDGHGSARILMYIPSHDCSFELDYTQVAEVESDKTLDQLALDLDGQSFFFDRFRIDRSLHRMKTAPEPWIGARVRVVQGHNHGLTGTVRDVNRYRVDLKMNPRASGIILTVELDVARGNIVSPQVRLDYDSVRELQTCQLLHQVIPPSWRQSFFMPSTTYIPTKDISLTDPVPARAYTPVIDCDAVSKLYEFVGAWHPGLDSGGIPTHEVDKLGPNFVAPPTHFLCNRNLLGISIRVDIVDGPYDTLKTKAGERYVIPTPTANGNILLRVDQPKIKVGDVFLDTTTVMKHRVRPKPSTEKRLMVVIGGVQEHIGKLVRRIHHFFKGSKTDANKWFKLVVVEFSGEAERVTDLELELSPNDVEFVRESDKVRRASTLLLAERRQFLSHSAPEILMNSTSWALPLSITSKSLMLEDTSERVRNDVKLNTMEVVQSRYQEVDPLVYAMPPQTRASRKLQSQTNGISPMLTLSTAQGSNPTRHSQKTKRQNTNASKRSKRLKTVLNNEEEEDNNNESEVPSIGSKRKRSTADEDVEKDVEDRNENINNTPGSWTTRQQSKKKRSNALELGEQDLSASRSHLLERAATRNPSKSPAVGLLSSASAEDNVSSDHELASRDVPSPYAPSPDAPSLDAQSPEPPAPDPHAAPYEWFLSGQDPLVSTPDDWEEEDDGLTAAIVAHHLQRVGELRDSYREKAWALKPHLAQLIDQRCDLEAEALACSPYHPRDELPEEDRLPLTPEEIEEEELRTFKRDPNDPDNIDAIYEHLKQHDMIGVYGIYFRSTYLYREVVTGLLPEVSMHFQKRFGPALPLEILMLHDMRKQLPLDPRSVADHEKHLSSFKMHNEMDNIDKSDFPDQPQPAPAGPSQPRPSIAGTDLLETVKATHGTQMIAQATQIASLVQVQKMVDNNIDKQLGELANHCDDDSVNIVPSKLQPTMFLTWAYQAKCRIMNWPVGVPFIHGSGKSHKRIEDTNEEEPDDAEPYFEMVRWSEVAQSEAYQEAITRFRAHGTNGVSADAQNPAMPNPRPAQRMAPLYQDEDNEETDPLRAEHPPPLPPRNTRPPWPVPAVRP
ncbi:hypothetical protein C8R42DRAFT_641630 [Lentinula raphanica]|nr:hypothetical protein C8R42DRAFT_649352 [Lentinula raphanica]KAJ3723450.1 hypothetical protein C8R42DRAFT_641630 [Lentinula raphanica]